MNALSLEQKTVLWCARTQIDSSAKGALRALVGGGLSWPAVVACARQHGLWPVVYESLIAAAPDLIPPDELDRLRSSAESSTANSLALVGELLRLCRLFEAAQIPAIPYKGPVLAWIAYGSFLRRDSQDLDFAVEQKYIPDSAAVLRSAGYRPLFDPREAHSGEASFAPGQYSFQLDSDGLLAELHTERTLRYFPVPIDLAEFTSSGMTIEIGGQRLRTFSVEHTLVLLSVHGAKHFWERLAWVLDIAKLAAVPEMNWALVLKIASQMKSRRVLLLGLILAQELFAAPLPEAVLRQTRKDRVARKLAEKVCEQYAGISDPRAGVWRRARFRIRSQDEIGRGIWHLLSLTLSPTESDRQTLRLPPWLGPLYMLVRPWRLLRQYGAGIRLR